MNKYQYKVKGVDYDVEIVNVEGNVAQVNVNGIPFEVELKQPINPATMPHKPVIAAPKPQPAAEAAPQKEKPAENAQAKGMKVTAPLPGTITEIKVKVGDTIKDGDTVVILGVDNECVALALHYVTRFAQFFRQSNEQAYLLTNSDD